MRATWTILSCNFLTRESKEVGDGNFDSVESGITDGDISDEGQSVGVTLEESGTEKQKAKKVVKHFCSFLGRCDTFEAI